MWQIGTHENKRLGRGIRLLVAIALFGIIILSSPGGAADGSAPRWAAGDVWSVLVSYPAAGDGWSDPVRWVYRVAATPETGHDGYILAVTGPEMKARLVYRGDFSLAEVEIVRAIRERRIVTDLAYEAGAPVLTERSPVPFDTPLFPLLSGAAGEYRVRHAIGDGLFVTVTVRQTVASIPGDEELLAVTCAWGDTEGFVQHWGQGRPWPLYGENRNMRYWLVEE